MVEISEIRDQESLERWFLVLPCDKEAQRKIALTVAHRAAMRVLPVCWEIAIGRELTYNELTSMSFNRRCIVSGFAAISPSPEISVTAPASATAAIASVRVSSYAAAAAAAAAARSATAAIATDSVYSHAAAVAGSANIAAGLIGGSEIWESLRTDCGLVETGQDPMDAPLWHGLDVPTARLWPALKERLLKLPETEGWDFWIDWYDHAMDPVRNGQQNVALLTEIVTQGEAFWKGTDKELNTRIAELVREFEGREATLSASNTKLTPKQELERNAQTVSLQIQALRSLIESELRELRGRNDVPEDDREQFASRIEILERIVARVLAMEGEFEAGEASSTALAVINENLPAVVEEVEAYDDTGGDPKVSEMTLAMGATIKHLTDRGTPGAIAAPYAAFDFIHEGFKKWRKDHRLSKS